MSRRGQFTHGASGYNRGCRCGVCVDAIRVYRTVQQQRRRSSRPARKARGIDCQCGQRITLCDGAFGSWKHVESNAERCADGNLATPKSPLWRQVVA